MTYAAILRRLFLRQSSEPWALAQPRDAASLGGQTSTAPQPLAPTYPPSSLKAKPRGQKKESRTPQARRKWPGAPFAPGQALRRLGPARWAVGPAHHAKARGADWEARLEEVKRNAAPLAHGRGAPPTEPPHLQGKGPLPQGEGALTRRGGALIRRKEALPYEGGGITRKEAPPMGQGAQVLGFKDLISKGEAPGRAAGGITGVGDSGTESSSRQAALSTGFSLWAKGKARQAVGKAPGESVVWFFPRDPWAYVVGRFRPGPMAPLAALPLVRLQDALHYALQTRPRPFSWKHLKTDQWIVEQRRYAFFSSLPG